MTTLLVFICCLMVGLFITLVSENRQLRRLVLNLSSRLDRQNVLLTRMAASPVREAPALAAESADPLKAAPASGPDSPEPAEDIPTIPGRRRPPNLIPPPKPGRFRRLISPAGLWPTLAALLVFGLATGFLIWFSLTLGSFSAALRLGVAFLAGLVSLTLGLLIWEKRPNLGLALEGYGLGLVGLTMAAAGGYFTNDFLTMGQVRVALTVLGLFAAVLAMRQNSPILTVLTPVAFSGLWAVMNPEWVHLTLTAAGAGFFYLALSLTFRRSSLPVRRLTMSLALIFFNMTLARLIFFGAPSGSLSSWTNLSLLWTLEGLILFRLDRRCFGALGLLLAALAASQIPDRFSGAPLSQFFLAVSALGGALLYSAVRPGRPRTKTVLVVFGLASWLAGSLASVWGLVGAQVGTSFILNWLLVVWSLFSLGLWLAGRNDPELLTSGPSDSPSFLVLAQALPLFPALTLVLGFFLPTLEVDFTEPGELNPAAWALWSLSQGLGLAQAKRFSLVSAWSNAFILALTLALSQAAPALFQRSPVFGQDMARLAAILGVLFLCSRPPRVAIFQELNLCRTAGLILSCLSLWQGLTLTLDPADRPGFFGFLPVLNLTNLAQAAALWLPVAFLRRLTAPDRPPALNLLQSILFFLWLNVVLARAVYHLAGVPYQLGALSNSAIFWGVCAGVWGGLALWFAGRRLGGQGLHLENAEEG